MAPLPHRMCCSPAASPTPAVPIACPSHARLPQEEAAAQRAVALEAAAICDALGGALEAWEVQQLLGGPYDDRGAVISIQVRLPAEKRMHTE